MQSVSNLKRKNKDNSAEQLEFDIMNKSSHAYSESIRCRTFSKKSGSLICSLSTNLANGWMDIRLILMKIECLPLLLTSC